MVGLLGAYKLSGVRTNTGEFLKRNIEHGIKEKLLTQEEFKNICKNLYLYEEGETPDTRFKDKYFPTARDIFSELDKIGAPADDIIKLEALYTPVAKEKKTPVRDHKDKVTPPLEQQISSNYNLPINNLCDFIKELIKDYTKEPKQSLLTACLHIFQQEKDNKGTYTRQDIIYTLELAIAITLQIQSFQITNKTKLGSDMRKLLKKEEFRDIRELIKEAFSLESSHLIAYKDLRKVATIMPFPESKDAKSAKELTAFFKTQSKNHLGYYSKELATISQTGQRNLEKKVISK
jgi:hypothetical protein